MSMVSETPTQGWGWGEVGRYIPTIIDILETMGTSQVSWTASTFPSLVSFPCILVPPTEDAWRDARKPSEERRNEEIRFKRDEMSFPLKLHVKRRPFVMTAAADHSWISCHHLSALTAVMTFDGVCVCTHTNINKRHTVISCRAAVFSLYSLLPVKSTPAHEEQPAFCIYTVYYPAERHSRMPLYYLFIICICIYWYSDCEFII